MDTQTSNIPAVIVPAGPLVILLGANITRVEFNGTVASDEAEQLLFIKQYLRNRVLKQFGVAEVAKTAVTGGKLYFNDGNRTALKLPVVKEHTNGTFAEDFNQYYDRCKPIISKWLAQSFQNAGITMEAVGSIGEI